MKRYTVGLIGLLFISPLLAGGLKVSGPSASVTTGWTKSGTLIYPASSSDVVLIGTTTNLNSANLYLWGGPNAASILLEMQDGGTGSTSSDGFQIQKGQNQQVNIYNYEDRLNFYSAGKNFIMNGTGFAIGNVVPTSGLDVNTNVSIGAAYAGSVVGPSNGLAIQGNVGIGTGDGSLPLHIVSSGTTLMELQSANGGAAYAQYTTASSLASWLVGADRVAGNSALNMYELVTGQYWVSISTSGSGIGGDVTPDATWEVASHAAPTGYALQVSSTDASTSMFGVLGNGEVQVSAGPIFPYSQTSSQIAASTPTAAGGLLYNSTLGVICQSTGTSLGQYGLIYSTTTACQ